jgi:DNA polymerase III sliding clamp (beta) subunit (PCNA family)
MDIEIRKDTLIRALERCLHPTGKDESQEYVGRVMLTVNNDKTANFYAVDTYLCVDTAVPLENVTEVGPRRAVDTKRLYTMAQNLRGDIVQMVVRDDKLTVTGDHRRSYTAQLVDPSSFPQLKEPNPKDPSITIAGTNLAYILQRAGHARDPIRPNLDGVKLRARKIEGREVPTLEAVAINGYSVVVVRHAQDIEGTLPFDAFLPSRLLKPLLALTKETSVTLRTSGAFIFAETEDTLLGALLPEGDFLDHETMMGHVEPFEAFCELPAIALQEALKAIMAVRTNKAACVRFKFAGGSLQLDLWHDPMQATDSVPVKLLGERESFEFFADPQYVIDHLKGADSDCELLSTKAPVMFQTSDGYIGFLSPQQRPVPEAPIEEPKPPKKAAAKKAQKKDGKPGPGRGGKKKTEKKTGGKKAAAPETSPEEDEDELGSADPSQYTT